MNESKMTFLVLLSLSKVNPKVAKTVWDGLKKNVDPSAAPLWVDSHGAGIFITTDLPAWKAWKTAGVQLSLDDWMDVKDLLVLQVGPDWYARDNQTKPAAWMNARYPKPAY
jgi:hypothetical protein